MPHLDAMGHDAVPGLHEAGNLGIGKVDVGITRGSFVLPELYFDPLPVSAQRNGGYHEAGLAQPSVLHVRVVIEYVLRRCRFGLRLSRRLRLRGRLGLSFRAADESAGRERARARDHEVPAIYVMSIHDYLSGVGSGPTQELSRKA